MTHHQFGAVVGDTETGGMFEVGAAVLLEEHITVAVATLSQGEPLSVIALQLSGRVNKSQDTVQAVFLISILDAGQVARALFDAARRIDTQESATDFQVGWNTTTEGG